MKIKRSSAYALHALMYMTRYGTQLPVPVETIAKAEGIPLDCLVKVLQQLDKAHFLKATRGRKSGFIFARPPEEINLLELFESIDGSPLFDDCPFRHCECAGTKENCRIFSVWINATRRIKELLEETTVAEAARNHPEHRFLNLPKPAN